MKFFKKINKISIIILAIAFTLGLGGIIVVRAVTPPNRGLGAANSYSVFGKAGITTTGVTNVWGNAGADSSVGLDDATQVDGSVYTGAGVAGVETDARSTYDSLMSALQGTPAGTVTGLDLAGTHTTLNGNPIVPGVYTVGATTMNGAVELSGAGVYIFRSDSSATIAATSAAVMTLTNGACASNVFWAIPASMTIGTGAHIEGTIIAHNGLISLATGATLKGRAISLISQVTLDANQITQPTCSTTGILHVIKTINNLHGGTLSKANFSFSVNDEDPVAFESDGTNDITVDAGTYSVTESAVAGYATSYNTCTDLVIAGGGSATCTITNNDIAPNLTLIKTRTNDNGGTADATDWTLDAAGPIHIFGATGSVDVTDAVVTAGEYTLSESILPAGYTASTYSCVKNGLAAVISNSITLAIGDDATCTITNDDTTPTLTLEKVVVGGSDDATDWTLTATGPTGFSGVGPTVNNDASFDAGTYNLSETGPAGYTASDWVCVGGTTIDGDTVSLALGESATCTITNTYIDPVSGGGGTVYGCKDEKATNYNYFSASNPALCIYASIPVVTPPFTPLLPKTGFPPQEKWYEFLLNSFLNLFR